MIAEEQAISPDAIENVICKPIEEFFRVPMDADTTGLFMQILLLPEEFAIPEKDKPFLYKVIEKRLEQCFSFKITDPRLILLITIISETPGTAIMYLWYLQYWCKLANVEELSLDQFCMHVFPMGFPSKDDLSILWDAQKVSSKNGSYNLVDRIDSGLSVQLSKINK